MQCKKARFAEKLKITSKWGKMHDEREDSNSEEDNESVQTIRKLGRDRLMRVHTKSSKARISNKDIEFKGLLKIVTLNMLRNLEFDY